jgi:ribonuclease R/exosome complex exonuclease DIS3/RRP44
MPTRFDFVGHARTIRARHFARIKKGKFRLDVSRLSQIAPASRYVIGTVDMKQTGKAYVILQEPGEDIYISPTHTGKALHEDTVKVFLFPRRPAANPKVRSLKCLNGPKHTSLGNYNYPINMLL